MNSSESEKGSGVVVTGQEKRIFDKVILPRKCNKAVLRLNFVQCGVFDGLSFSAAQLHSDNISIQSSVQ